MIECDCKTPKDCVENMIGVELSSSFTCKKLGAIRSELRPVSVRKYQRKPGEAYMELVPDGHGLFHGFGVDYEDTDAGPGNFSTAIIERPDGTIINVPVHLIRFEDEGVREYRRLTEEQSSA